MADQGQENDGSAGLQADNVKIIIYWDSIKTPIAIDEMPEIATLSSVQKEVGVRLSLDPSNLVLTLLGKSDPLDPTTILSTLRSEADSSTKTLTSTNISHGRPGSGE